MLSHYILYHYRILCTHHVNYLQEADTVVVLDNGTLKYCGQPSAVLPLVAAEEENKGDAADQESEPKQVSPVKQFHHFCTHHCIKGADISSAYIFPRKLSHLLLKRIPQ